MKNRKIFTGKYGIRYYIDPSSYFDINVVKSGIWPELMLSQTAIDFLRTVIKDDSCILDVGAHKGAYCLIYKKELIPNGKLIAFEAHSAICDVLKDNIKLNNLDIQVVGKAAQDDKDADTLSFHYSSYVDKDGINDAVSSLEKCPHEVSRTDMVPATTCDKEAENENVSLIKIDVEGSEYKVLKGSMNILTNSRPIVVYEQNMGIENVCRTNNCGNCYTLLESLGYVFYHTIPGERAMTRMHNFIPQTFVEIIAIPKEKFTSEVEHALSHKVRWG